MRTNLLQLQSSSTKKTKWVVRVAKAICLFFLFFACSYATVNFGAYTSFAFGLYFALLLFSYPVFLTSGLFVVAYGLAQWSLVGLYSALNVVIVGILVTLLHKKLNKKINPYLLVVYALLGNGAYLYFHIHNTASAIATSVSVVLGLLFMLACAHFLKALFAKAFKTKLNVDELISGSVMLLVVSMGLAAMAPFGIEMVKVFAVVAIIISTYLFPPFASLYVGSVMGLGAALHLGNLHYVSAFVLFSLLATAFKSNNKLYGCLAIVLCDIVLGLYFNTYPNYSVFGILSVVLGEILVLLLPMQLVALVGEKLGGVKDKVAMRNIINRSKESISHRMNEIANVFSEMDHAFRAMVKGLLPLADAKKMITTEVIAKLGKNSPEVNQIMRTDSKGTYQMFEDLVTIGLERGKVTLLDIPPFVTSKVGKVNFLVNTLNQLLSSYKHYATMVGNMDASRAIIADQLSGISSILRSLAKEVNLNISFDLSKENRILEECSFGGMSCYEAIVYEQSANIIHATILVLKTDYKPELLQKIVSKVVGCKMKVVSETDSTVSGYLVITLKTQPNYDIVFGSASSGKSGEMVNGDTHSILKIDDGKFMVALCDGMGSGLKANSISNLSIGLIENFYKAGFDNELILNSVNKLLSQNSDETFTALDICVLDTRKGLCDFIKLGSPQGYLKHGTSTDVIETCGLPMGVLDEMQPHITKKVLSDHDIIVLVSDGITQAFEDAEQDFYAFVHNLSGTNPQTIANEILDRAVDLQNGVCNDDMTVVAVRVFALS